MVCERVAVLAVLNMAQVKDLTPSLMPIARASRVTQPALRIPAPPPMPDDDDEEDPLPAAHLHGMMREAYDVLVDVLLQVPSVSDRVTEPRGLSHALPRARVCVS